LKTACVTDIGRARDINEDGCTHYDFVNGWSLLMVADGMGGHNAGEVASSIAIHTIADYIGKRMNSHIDEAHMECILKDAIVQANTDIYNEAQDNISCSGMGTTVTAAMISGDIALIGHVGDSRAYIFINNKLHRITNDHSLVAELVKNGTITEDEAQHHPQKNVITRALGAKDSVNIDIERVEAAEGTILLCTDGLSNMLSDDEIEKVLNDAHDIDDAAHKLVDLANNLGGYDNITVAAARLTCLDEEVRQ
jgi:protein phosphatase